MKWALPTAWIAWAPALVVLTLASGCSIHADDSYDSTGQAIYSGTRDVDQQATDSVVALKVDQPDGPGFTLCSAALIAPNLVLTARHCISTLQPSNICCDENGRSSICKDQSADGSLVIDEQRAAQVHVYTGANPDFQRKPAANGRSILHPGTLDPQINSVCNQDIALVVLDSAIAQISPLPVRLRAKTQSGEQVRAVGYGMNNANVVNAQGEPYGFRFRKEGLDTLAVGPTISPYNTRLGPNELEVGRSICEGDSGGPAISEETGAVVGVVSRGPSNCDESYGHVYTLTMPFATLIQKAFAAAGATPIEEPSVSSTSGNRAHDLSYVKNDDALTSKSGEGSCQIAFAGTPTTSARTLLFIASAMLLSRRRRKPLRSA